MLFFCFFKANARVEQMKNQLKELKKQLKEAEKRAIIAERTVKKLLKEVDSKEGKSQAIQKKKCTAFDSCIILFFR